MDDGIWPENSFADKSNRRSIQRLPIRAGIPPLKLFFSIISSVRLTRFSNIPVGKLPDNWFLPSLSDTSWFEKLDMESGNTPPNWLSLKSRICKFLHLLKELKKLKSFACTVPKEFEARISHHKLVRPPKSIATSPVKLLPLTSNSRRFVALDSDDGKVPVVGIPP